MEVRSVDLGDISLSVTTAGGDGPAVILLHGFPEIAYSWRHQIPALADAGYRVLAPDQRGYGFSDAPPDVADYGIFELAGDITALALAHDIDEFVLVGHDWGAILAAQYALFRPDMLRGLVLMSVPFRRREDISLIKFLTDNDPDGDFAYMLAFQEEGVEALPDADPISFLRSVHWNEAAAGPARGEEAPDGLPPHLSEGDMEAYARAFMRSGFRGGINWYRNLQQNWQATRPWHQAAITVPTLFVGGAEDFVIKNLLAVGADANEAFGENHTDLRDVVIVENAGHWVQQESPEQVNEALLSFLGSLG